MYRDAGDPLPEEVAGALVLVWELVLVLLVLPFELLVVFPDVEPPLVVVEPPLVVVLPPLVLDVAEYRAMTVLFDCTFV